MRHVLRGKGALSLLAAALLMLGGGRAARALSENDCTFYAPLDGITRAAEARGDGNAVARGALRFAPGIRGQGLLEGATGSTVEYHTDGNFDLTSGSVSLWVQPQNWSDTSSGRRVFFALSEGPNPPEEDGGTLLWLYRPGPKSAGFMVQDSRHADQRTLFITAGNDPRQTSAMFTAGQWTHLVATWNGDEVQFFINGVFQSRVRTSTPRILRAVGPFFTIGGRSPSGDDDTVIDEVRIFDRALTAPEVQALYAFQLSAQPQQQVLTPEPMPDLQQLKVDVDAVAHRPDEARNLEAHVILTSVPGGQTVGVQDVSFTNMPYTTATISTAGLAPGNYRITSTLSDGGRQIDVATADWTLDPPPSWAGSQLGLADVVPTPFTPLTLDPVAGGYAAGCCGPRRYQFGPALYPVGLSTLGQDLLAGPIRLVGTVNGQAVDQPAVTLTETHSPTHATVTASAAGGGTTLETTNALDYAGLLWTHLQIQGSGPLSVSDLTLEVPLKAAAATLMQTSYGWEDAGAVKAWNNQVGPGMQLWLGNDDGGLQVSLPSAQYWRGGDRDRQVEIEPHGDQVILRLRLVQGRVSFAESAIDYQVGFQVTPVRAPPAGWRLWRFAPIPAPGTPGRWFAPFYTNSWDEGVSYPVPRREAWLKRFTDAAAQGSQPVLYMQPFTASPAMPDYADYAAEWRKKLGVPAPPADPNANPEAEDRLCPREGSWSDYFVATFFSLMDGASKDVPWGGVYFDNDDVPICDDGDHGCGWVDENGVRQPERRWLEASALHKRFYVAMQQLHPDKLIFSHCSGHPDMSLLGFCDAMIDGEQLGPAMPAHNWNYHDILTLDRMRAEFMGSNYGHVAIFLPELAQPVYLHMGQGGEELRDHFNLEPEPAEEMQVIGLVMAHDILPWPLYETLTPFYHLWAVEDAFGWGDDVEFLPYWKNQTLVTVAPADPNVVCSLYRKAGKLMAVVVNNTGADRDVTLQFHADALNLPALAQADHMLDAWTGASFAFHAYQHDVHGVPRPQPDWQTQAGQETRVPMTGGQVTVHVPAWGFRLLVTPQ